MHRHMVAAGTRSWEHRHPISGTSTVTGGAGGTPRMLRVFVLFEGFCVFAVFSAFYLKKPLLFGFSKKAVLVRPHYY